MATNGNGPDSYVEAIRRSGLTIYDPIEIGDPELWIPTSELERLLNEKITGSSLGGLPLRTRSKVVKERICQALGYPAPSSFRKTNPRFPGQCFDTYIQKSNNLQIWNEEITPLRRYVIVRLGEDDIIAKVKVITGNVLAQLDTTGALTHKYQARLIPGESSAELIATEDTERLRHIVRAKTSPESITSDPVSYPEAGEILPIKQIFEELQALLGESFPDAGYDQERNRGAALHRLVCQRLGYADYQDDGQFPDILHQLLEIKLQTSPTIDLGLVCPDSEEVLDIPRIAGQHIRHCDVRYALFYAITDGQWVTLTHFFLTTGARFFSRFPQFQGKSSNWKIQIPLPADFFDD